MKLNKLASAILRGNWLMEHRAATGMLPMAHRFIKGEKVSWFGDDDDDEEDPYLSTYIITPEGARSRIKASQNETPTNIFDDAPAGSVFVIPISGTIMKDDYCGSPGTATMSNWLKDARDSENIVGGVLLINSGGGSVEGTAEFAAVIEEVSKDMPLEVFTDGMIASAAYWIASALYITASSETVEIGSIGTAIRFMDYSKYYEELGIQEHYINADKSFDKNQDFYDAKKGNYEPIRQNILNPTNEVFHKAVLANRGDKLQLTEIKDADGKVIGQEPLTGKMYIAQTAIDIGLIDAIGTLDIVLSSVRTRAGAENLIANQKNTDMSLFGSKFKKLTAIKTKKAEEISTEDIEGINEEFTAEGYSNVVVISTAHFEEANANADVLEGGLTAINAALGAGKEKTTLNEAIEALIADRNAEHDRAEEYGEQPGEVPTNTKSKTTVEGNDLDADKKDKNNKFTTSYDSELEEIEAKLK